MTRDVENDEPAALRMGAGMGLVMGGVFGWGIGQLIGGSKTKVK